MLIGRPQTFGSGYNEFGFSFNPIHAITHVAKAVGHGVATGARATGHGVATGARFARKHAMQAVELAVLPVAALNKLVAGPILKRALRPVKRRVDTLKDRRARKIAMDRRRSTAPTAAEKSEARSWAKSKVKGEIPFGPILSALAGPPEVFLGDYEPNPGLLGEPVTIATILSSIPLLIAIMDRIMGHASASGEAPASPGDVPASQAADDAQAVAQAAQDAAQQATDDAGGGDDGSAAPGAVAPAPGGGGFPIQRSHMLIGGAIAIGLVAVLLITKKKS